jgi:hypothetical protein
MFVLDPAALLRQPVTPAAAERRRSALPLRLLRALGAQQQLLRRHRVRPRPTGCGWVPRRVWARHSALLCLCAGAEPCLDVERRVS